MIDPHTQCAGKHRVTAKRHSGVFGVRHWHNMSGVGHTSSVAQNQKPAINKHKRSRTEGLPPATILALDHDRLCAPTKMNNSL